MLVLTRRQRESLRIGEDVVITILAVKHGHVRIGVDAPKTIPVHQQEIYGRIHRNGSPSPHSPEAVETPLL